MAKADVLTEKTEAVLEKVTESLNEQVNLTTKFMDLYQAQVEKATKLWLDNATKAMSEGQKAVKEWTDLGNQLAADSRKAFEANLKEAGRMFSPTV